MALGSSVGAGVLLVFAALAVVSNTILIAALCKHRKKPPNAYILIALAITDIVFAVVIGSDAALNQWTDLSKTSGYKCTMHSLEGSFGLVCAALVTIAVVERLTAVNKLVFPRKVFKPRHMKSVLGLWSTLSGTVGLLLKLVFSTPCREVMATDPRPPELLLMYSAIQLTAMRIVPIALNTILLILTGVCLVQYNKLNLPVVHGRHPYRHWEARCTQFIMIMVAMQVVYWCVDVFYVIINALSVLQINEATKMLISLYMAMCMPSIRPLMYLKSQNFRSNITAAMSSLIHKPPSRSDVQVYHIPLTATTITKPDVSNSASEATWAQRQNRSLMAIRHSERLVPEAGTSGLTQCDV